MRPLDVHDERAIRGWARGLRAGATPSRVVLLIRWWVERFDDTQRARGFPE